MNSTLKGNLAQTILLEDESLEHFNILLANLWNELKPASTLEEILVDDITAACWRRMRSRALEAARLNHQINVDRLHSPEHDLPEGMPSPNPPTRAALAIEKLHDSSISLAELSRTEARYTRAINSSLAVLKAMRKQKSTFLIH